MFRRVASCLLCTLTVAPLAAQVSVPPSECLVIVASRQTLGEVRAFHAENRHLDFGPVYLASNGWYAISVGSVPQAHADRILDRQKALDIIPRDSLCSSGRRYVRIALPAPSPPREAPPVRSLAPDVLFDPGWMTWEEVRFLQAALAVAGYYNGALDGRWGALSQGALAQLVRDVGGSVPLNSDALAVMIVGAELLHEGGWDLYRPTGFDLSLMLPFAWMEIEASGSDFIRLNDPGGAFVVLINRSRYSPFGSHEGAAARHGGPGDLYVVREADRLVTAALDGPVMHYMRSDLRRGLWITVSLLGAASSGEMKLASGSIGPASQTASRLPAGSTTQRHIDGWAEGFAGVGIDPAKPPPEASPPRMPGPSAAGSGSGFFVTAEGHVLTNHRVIEGCARIEVDGVRAEVLASEQDWDLALLSTRPAGTPLPFSPAGASVNADITIAGYPLHGILGGEIVTRGAVSALSGMGGDATRMQISASVQPGNSGGPAVDSRGGVVGVVVSRADDQAVFDRTGALPQNINFAVHGTLAQLFLSAKGVVVVTLPASAAVLAPEDLARRLMAATVHISCQR